MWCGGADNPTVKKTGRAVRTTTLKPTVVLKPRLVNDHPNWDALLFESVHIKEISLFILFLKLSYHGIIWLKNGPHFDLCLQSSMNSEEQASNKFNLCNEKSLTNILFPCCCYSAQVFPYYVCRFHSQWGKSPASFSVSAAAHIYSTLLNST